MEYYASDGWWARSLPMLHTYFYSIHGNRKGTQLVTEGFTGLWFNLLALTDPNVAEGSHCRPREGEVRGVGRRSPNWVPTKFSSSVGG